MLTATHKVQDARGFTLIEVLVSVSIFATVMTMSLGALLAMSENNRKVETMKSVINTLNFSLDSISRSVRTGRLYQCNPSSVPFGGNPTPASCDTTPSTKFAFKDAEGRTIAYCLGNGSTCSATGSAILRSENGGTLAAITSKEVVVQTLDFFVVGAASGDSVQPKVTILLTGYVVVAGTAANASECGTSRATCSTFNLQTSVTQRIYDQ